ncbi:hypothetical protein [Paenibacillus sp. BAC0078]
MGNLAGEDWGQLQNKPEHAKMAASLLLTLPGNPCILLWRGVWDAWH